AEGERAPGWCVRARRGRRRRGGQSVLVAGVSEPSRHPQHVHGGPHVTPSGSSTPPLSDARHGQENVEANVRVMVTSVSARDVTLATPLSLAAVPEGVVKDEGEGSILSKVVSLVEESRRTSGEEVRLLCVEPGGGGGGGGGGGDDRVTSTRVWLTSPSPLHLHHTILHHADQLRAVAGVALSGVGVGACGKGRGGRGGEGREGDGDGGDEGGYSLVDAGAVAIVGPRRPCRCTRGHHPTTAALDTCTPHTCSLDTCTPHTCLNGGRCLPTHSGAKCLCPHGTSGSRCKVHTRTFPGSSSSSSSSGGVDGGWVWVQPPTTPGSENQLSLEFLTGFPEATLLYSGPDHLGTPPPSGNTTSSSSSSSVLALQLVGGRPSLVVDLGGAGGPSVVTLSTGNLADLTWHTIHLAWDAKVVELVVDMCTGGSLESIYTPDHQPPVSTTNTITTTTTTNTRLPEASKCRVRKTLGAGVHVLNPCRPLQVGGLAHPLPPHLTHALTHAHLAGCIRNLRINGQVVDLGDGVVSGGGSEPGCSLGDCATQGDICLHHGMFRTRHGTGQLVSVWSEQGGDSMSLRLVSGRLCLTLRLHPDPPTSLCLSTPLLADGHWHAVMAHRYGSSTFLSADEGDGDLYNTSLRLEGPRLLEIDKQEGVRVGGSPEYDVSGGLTNEDYFDGCLDDVRVNGLVVPLPPAANTSEGAQVTMFQGVTQGCTAPPAACHNISCPPPLTCINTWRSYRCGCEEGQVLQTEEGRCEDQNECEWEPCLHSGSCLNTSPGFECVCTSAYTGQYCQLPHSADTSLKLSLAALVATLVWCTVLLLVVCAFLLHQHHKRSGERKTSEGGKEEDQPRPPPAPNTTTPPNLLELQLLRPPRANGRPAWSSNPHIADVDVLQVEHSGETTPGTVKGGDSGEKKTSGKKGKSGGEKKEERGKTQPSHDDLRNYAYEGEGSSPGSLSSCLESCSGSAKFLGGFREVAHLLESWEPNVSTPSTHTTPTRASVAVSIPILYPRPITPTATHPQQVTLTQEHLHRQPQQDTTTSTQAPHTYGRHSRVRKRPQFNPGSGPISLPHPPAHYRKVVETCSWSPRQHQRHLCHKPTTAGSQVKVWRQTHLDALTAPDQTLTNTVLASSR
ncbi:hypothetical protein Pcinc_004389, partial [Petrolisthes cinctipes]